MAKRANTADAATEGGVLYDDGGTINLPTNTELEERRMWKRHVDVSMMEIKPERNDSKGR